MFIYDDMSLNGIRPWQKAHFDLENFDTELKKKSEDGKNKRETQMTVDEYNENYYFKNAL